jgi:hypothetical protein
LAFTIEDEDKLYEDFLNPGVVAEVAQESKLWDQVDFSDDLQMGGYTFRQKVMVKVSKAARASNDDNYPSAQKTTPAEVIGHLKRSMMFSLEFSGFALDTALKKGTGGSVMDPFKFEETGIMITVREDLARQLMWDGSGRLCQAKGQGTTSTTLIVDSPYLKKQPTKFLKEDRVIDAYDPADDSHDIDSIAVETQDSDTQVTLVSAQSWADDCWIYNEDVWKKTEAPGEGEMMGLLGIASDANPPTGALQQLDVTAYPMWKAWRWHNNGTPRPLSEDLLILAVQKAKKWGDINKMFMLITEKIERVWISFLKSYQIQNTNILWGGWHAVPFYYGGKQIPMVPDEYVPDGMIIGGDKSKLTIYVTQKGKEVTWEKGLYGGGRLRNLEGKNRYGSYGHIFSNMGVSVRKAFFRIEDIQEPDV